MALGKIVIQHNDSQQNSIKFYCAECPDYLNVMTDCHYAECHYDECHYAECCGAVLEEATSGQTNRTLFNDQRDKSDRRKRRHDI